MSSVGGTSVTFLRGSVGGLRQRVELWQVPGLNGYGALRLGTGQADFSFRAIHFGSLATLVSLLSTIEGKQGTSVTLVDDRGTSHTSCLITSVGKPEWAPITGAPSGETYRISIPISGVKLA